MKKINFSELWLNCPALRLSVIAIACLLLLGMLSGCSTTPVYRDRLVLPDPNWVMPTEIGLSIDDLTTYEAVTQRALTASLRAVGQCNIDKALLRDFYQKHIEAAKK